MPATTPSSALKRSRSNRARSFPTPARQHQTRNRALPGCVLQSRALPRLQAQDHRQPDHSDPFPLRARTGGSRLRSPSASRASKRGADGSAILKGTGAPAAGLGVDGDQYIDTVSRDVYQKAGGAWSIITNLSGGPAGPKGDPGTPGSSSFFSRVLAHLRTSPHLGRVRCRWVARRALV